MQILCIKIGLLDKIHASGCRSLPSCRAVKTGPTTPIKKTADAHDLAPADHPGRGRLRFAFSDRYAKPSPTAFGIGITFSIADEEAVTATVHSFLKEDPLEGWKLLGWR